MTDLRQPTFSGTASSDMEKPPIYNREYSAATLPEEAEQRQNNQRNCLLRRICIIFSLFVGFYMLVKQSPFHIRCHEPGSSISDDHSGMAEQMIMSNKEHHGLAPSNLDIGEPHKIPLEAHIMSKCPDAQSCLQKLILPTMENVNDKVDFQLSFIAK